ncbi:MAG: hypothetical protein JWN52_1463 [Actinomycetia bacterium]|nr:hypothetical protein [Actinomycetes bacterium]
MPCPAAPGQCLTQWLLPDQNEPSEVQPTAIHTSVTLMPPRSSAIARSTRRVIK